MSLHTRLRRFERHLAALSDHAADVRSIDESTAARLGEARRVIDHLLRHAVVLTDDLAGQEARQRELEARLPPVKDLKVVPV